VRANTGKAAGVEGLHQQCAHTTDECAEVGMHDPCCIIREIKPAAFARCNGFEPWRISARVSAEKRAKSAGENFL
jgi:hypothetical protein